MTNTTLHMVQSISHQNPHPSETLNDDSGILMSTILSITTLAFGIFVTYRYRHESFFYAGLGLACSSAINLIIGYCQYEKSNMHTETVKVRQETEQISADANKIGQRAEQVLADAKDIHHRADLQQQKMSKEQSEIANLLATRAEEQLKIAQVNFENIKLFNELKNSKQDLERLAQIENAFNEQVNQAAAHLTAIQTLLTIIETRRHGGFGG